MRLIPLVVCGKKADKYEFQTKPKKLAESEINEALSQRVGTWKVFDESSGKIFETYTGEWVKKGESIEIKGKPEDGAPPYNQTVTYDPVKKLFIENFNNGDLIRHTTWNADTKTLESLVIEPKSQDGVSEILFIKKKATNKNLSWLEIRQNGRLLKKELEATGLRMDGVDDSKPKAENPKD